MSAQYHGLTAHARTSGNGGGCRYGASVGLLQVAAVRAGHLGQAQPGRVKPADRPRSSPSKRFVRDSSSLSSSASH